jgi:hypothetical protein
MTQLAGAASRTPRCRSVVAFYERERVIRKDERTKHLDRLIMERKGMIVETSSPFESTGLRKYKGEIKQHTVIGNWQFLRRRSPCVEAHVVLSATVKIPK